MSAEALSSLGAPCEENFSALCKVMGDLECEGETYVFLDNLSGAEEGIELFLSLLSRAASPALHFVVSVRTAGTESDFRFYGGRFYTLSASDFAFTKADIRAYFSLCGITLIEEEVEELYRLTDGWIFAICLQMLFYSQNKRFEKGIFESLVKKAFYARLSEREKNFYISLAPFYSFSLCKAREISGESADFVRAHLEGCGFVHYNEKSEEYYFHALLADFFCAVFDSLSEEERKSRLLTAASWEEQYGEKIGVFHRKARRVDPESALRNARKRDAPHRGIRQRRRPYVGRLRTVSAESLENGSLFVPIETQNAKDVKVFLLQDNRSLKPLCEGVPAK